MNSHAANAAAEGSVSVSARRAPGVRTTAYGGLSGASVVTVLAQPPFVHQRRHVGGGGHVADRNSGISDANPVRRGVVPEELDGGGHFTVVSLLDLGRGCRSRCTFLINRRWPESGWDLA